MRIYKKIILGVFVLILVTLTAVCVWQWENINAVIKTMTSTSEQIAREMDDTKKQLEDDIKQQYPSVISDFTAEEEKKILKGEMSVDEAVEVLNRKYENSKNNATASKGPSPETDRLISEKVIELYSLKAYYLGQLGQMEAVVKKDYAALPKEKRNLLGKKEIVSRYMGKAMGLLEQCDARVETLLAELKTELNALNADTSIINKIRAAYESEKKLKKAYYMKLMDE